MVPNMFGYGLKSVMVIGMALIPLIVIVGVVFLIVKLAQNNNSNNNSARPDQSIQILKERYARGEIEEEEFQHKMDMLKRP